MLLYLVATKHDAISVCVTIRPRKHASVHVARRTELRRCQLFRPIAGVGDARRLVRSSLLAAVTAAAAAAASNIKQQAELRLHSTIIAEKI